MNNGDVAAEVSDNDLSDMDDDELDNLIDVPEINQIGNHSSTNAQTITSANTILNREYGEELPPPSLPIRVRSLS